MLVENRRRSEAVPKPLDQKSIEHLFPGGDELAVNHLAVFRGIGLLDGIRDAVHFLRPEKKVIRDLADERPPAAGAFQALFRDVKKILVRGLVHLRGRNQVQRPAEIQKPRHDFRRQLGF